MVGCFPNMHKELGPGFNSQCYKKATEKRICLGLSLAGRSVSGRLVSLYVHSLLLQHHLGTNCSSPLTAFASAASVL